MMTRRRQFPTHKIKENKADTLFQRQLIKLRCSNTTKYQNKTTICNQIRLTATKWIYKHHHQEAFYEHSSKFFQTPYATHCTWQRLTLCTTASFTPANSQGWWMENNNLVIIINTAHCGCERKHNEIKTNIQDTGWTQRNQNNTPKQHLLCDAFTEACQQHPHQHPHQQQWVDLTVRTPASINNAHH